MRHIYQINESLWEVHIGNYNESIILDVQGENELSLYLDILQEMGVDFVIHELGGIDEYQIALPI